MAFGNRLWPLHPDIGVVFTKRQGTWGGRLDGESARDFRTLVSYPKIESGTQIIQPTQSSRVILPKQSTLPEQEVDTGSIVLSAKTQIVEIDHTFFVGFLQWAIPLFLPDVELICSLQLSDKHHFHYTPGASVVRGVYQADHCVALGHGQRLQRSPAELLFDYITAAALYERRDATWMRCRLHYGRVKRNLDDVHLIGIWLNTFTIPKAMGWVGGDSNLQKNHRQALFDGNLGESTSSSNSTGYSGRKKQQSPSGMDLINYIFLKRYDESFVQNLESI